MKTYYILPSLEGYCIYDAQFFNVENEDEYNDNVVENALNWSFELCGAPISVYVEDETTFDWKMVATIFA